MNTLAVSDFGPEALALAGGVLVILAGQFLTMKINQEKQRGEVDRVREDIKGVDVKAEGRHRETKHVLERHDAEIRTLQLRSAEHSIHLQARHLHCGAYAPPPSKPKPDDDA